MFVKHGNRVVNLNMVTDFIVAHNYVKFFHFTDSEGDVQYSKLEFKTEKEAETAFDAIIDGIVIGRKAINL